MKEYSLIVVGSGSATNIIDSMIDMDPDLKIALIDKDEPGGICLTRGCIPSKMLLYPAELIRLIKTSSKFGVETEIKKIDFKRVMNRMRNSISEEVEEIRRGLSSHPKIDYYPTVAEFVAPYTMKVANETIRAKMIFLCTGSKPFIPPLKGLESAGYLTSDTVLGLTKLPESVAILGGGYIAAEYGHFFAAMGSRVIVIGRNPQILPDEEPEVAALAKREMSRYLTIFTNHEVTEVQNGIDSPKKVLARDRTTGKEVRVAAAEILVAAGRAPNTDILHPERGDVKKTQEGWIEVNEYLETSQPNIWAFGDADGKYPFKHKANYESLVLYYNAVLKQKVKVDYHAIPHAVFSWPEIASVGLKEKEALERYGEEKVLIGLQRFEDTAKGQAMELKDFFVKVIVQNGTNRILGAHIIGPQASVLIQEIITLMYTPQRSADPITRGMHIHPALSEVVERAFQSLAPPAHYHHVLKETLGIERLEN
jgi:dihydrolipoamide dehydrogenase